MSRALGLGNNRVVITAEEHAQGPLKDVVHKRRDEFLLVGSRFGKPGGLGLFTIQFECEEIILFLFGCWQEYEVPVLEFYLYCMFRDPNFDSSLLGWFLE